MTREEHLAWCKQRALEHIELARRALKFRGRVRELSNAFASMTSDLTKHPETAALERETVLRGVDHTIQGDTGGMRAWIEGFR